MLKTSFELEIKAETLVGATALAEEKISEFLGIAPEQVSSTVDIELRVKTKDGDLVVVVYGVVKRGLGNLIPN